jgi:hypothetical protein
LVLNRSLGVSYVCDQSDLDDSATQTREADADGFPTGSTTKSAGRSASFTLTYATEADERDGSANLTRAGHLLEHRGRFFIAAGCKVTLKSGDAIKFSTSAMECVNPVITSLLSAEGQFKRFTGTAGAPFSHAPSIANAREDAVISYALESIPGRADKPAGLVVNATTGAVSWPTPTAGTHCARLVVTDTVTDEVIPENQRVRKGFADLFLVVT